MKILGIIPARYASTRFPGKPLHLIAGKPLIQHVVERCRQATTLAEIIVATDDARIAEVARKFCRVEMTSDQHPSGTDRIAEVISRCECDAAVNIQGDEPLIDPGVVNAVAQALIDSPMSTAATPIKDLAEYDNPNVVKVVVNVAGRALYFSRAPVPYVRDPADAGAQQALARQHVGVYAYTRAALQAWVGWAPHPLELVERLEQLRPLAHGLAIGVADVPAAEGGIDTEDDLERANLRWNTLLSNTLS